MITRKFDQKWHQQTSPINGRTEGNVLFDFVEYIMNLKRDFKTLEKDYEEEFDKLSKRSLKSYINLFNKKCSQFFALTLKDYKQTNSISAYNSLSKYNDKLFVQNGNNFKINDDFYEILNKIAQNIFKIEDEVSMIVEKFWINAISNIDDYDKDKKYFLLAHVDRKFLSPQALPQALNSYSQSLQGLCFSAISSEKTRLYNNSQNAYDYYYNPNGAVGIIANPKMNSIVGISNTDMLSTEFISGKCEFNKYFYHSKVNRCFVRDNSEIYCSGTKICPPREIFNINVDTINEIILDSKNIDIVALFYLKDSYGEIPERFDKYKKEQEKICGHSLPVIEVTSRNKLKQLNLDEIFWEY